MRNTVLNVLNNEVKKIYSLKPNIWIDDQLTEKDLENLKNESYSMGNFDKMNLKKEVYDAFINKEANAIIKKTNNARVVILTNKSSDKFPWITWGRLFQWIGSPINGSAWQIYIYASEKERLLPEDYNTVGPEHLNGGYTEACNHECIIIYRYEECTRVLIHELLHAACTDDLKKSVEQREAETESWAELFLVSLLSKGNINKIYTLWKLQENYIQDLNYTLKHFYNVNTESDYAARYTIMRTDVFKRFKIYFDKKYNPQKINTSRFTNPKLDIYLE